MIVEKLKEFGYDYSPLDVKVTFKDATFHRATKVGNLVFTSGQVPLLNGQEMRGRVGADIDLETAAKGAEICAYNCICAAGSVVDIESIEQVVKLFGMVNVAEGFNQTSEVINGASVFLYKLLGEQSYHARTAVGMTLPSDWAVEIDMVFAVK